MAGSPTGDDAAHDERREAADAVDDVAARAAAVLRQAEEAAAARGRAMVDEARAVRKRMLDDLERRRATLLEELERVRDDRDKARKALDRALKEAEHRRLMQARFPAWVERVEYWHVHDLDCALPTKALPQVRQHVEELVLRLKRRLSSSACA